MLQFVESHTRKPILQTTSKFHYHNYNIPQITRIIRNFKNGKMAQRNVDKVIVREKQDNKAVSACFSKTSLISMALNSCFDLVPKSLVTLTQKPRSDN